MNLMRTLYPSWRTALLGGGKSISLKKSPSVANALLSYDWARTVRNRPTTIYDAVWDNACEEQCVSYLCFYSRLLTSHMLSKHTNRSCQMGRLFLVRPTWLAAQGVFVLGLVTAHALAAPSH